MHRWQTKYKQWFEPITEWLNVNKMHGYEANHSQTYRNITGRDRERDARAGSEGGQTKQKRISNEWAVLE